MKRIASLLLMLAMVVGLALPALAVDRVQWRTGIQPPSNWLNTMEKNKEIAIGQLVWDMMGRNNSGGFFTNLAVTPSTGLYFNVGPASTNQLGSVYQIAPADLTAFGDGAGQIPADPTIIFHQGLTNSQTTYGPLTAPTGSFSVIDLIECQVNTVDTTQQTVNFVSATNVASSAQANRDRADKVLCQAKLGTPAASPVVPTVDSGWVAIAQVNIPANSAQLTSSMITMLPQFNGFLPAGSAATFMDLSSNQTAAGNKTFSGVTSLANLLDFTNGAVTFSNLPQIAGDYQANPGLLLNVATGSKGVQFMTNGALNGAYVNTSGTYYTGSSYLANNALNVAGPATINGATFDGSTLTAASTNLALNGKPGGAGVLANYGSGVTTFRAYDGGTVNYAQLLATGLSFSGAGTSTYTSTNAYIDGNISGANLPVGQCLTVDSGHNIIGAGGACGLQSGTISNVTGTAPITASVTSGVATVGISATPSFTGPVTIGSASTIGQLNLGTDGNLNVNRSGGTVTWQGLNGVTPILNASGGFQSGSSYYYPTYASVNGDVSGSSLTVQAFSGGKGIWDYSNLGGSPPATGSGAFIGWNRSSGDGEADIYTLFNNNSTNATAVQFRAYVNNNETLLSDITRDGAYHTGSSFFGPTSATVNGSLTAVGSLTSPNIIFSGGISGASASIYTDVNSTIYLQMPNVAGQVNPFRVQLTNSNYGGVNLLNGMGLSLQPVSAPSAPTLSQAAGGTLPATTYYVKTSYSNGYGTTTVSSESSLAVSANNVLVVTAPPASANATSWQVYVGTSAGAETQQGGSLAFGTNWTEPTTGLATGAAMPTFNTTYAPLTIGSSTYGAYSEYLNGVLYLTGATGAGTSSDYIGRTAADHMVFQSTDTSGNFLFRSGTTSDATIGTGGVSVGSSTYGPTSATVNGTLNVGGGTWDGVTINSASNSLVLDGQGNSASRIVANYANNATGGFRIFDGGIANYGWLQSSGLSFSSDATTSYGPTSATVHGNIVASGTTSITLNPTTGVITTGASTFGPSGSTVNGSITIPQGSGYQFGGTNALMQNSTATYLYTPSAGNIIIHAIGGSNTDIAEFYGANGNLSVNGSYNTGSSTYGPTNIVVAGQSSTFNGSPASGTSGGYTLAVSGNGSGTTAGLFLSSGSPSDGIRVTGSGASYSDPEGGVGDAIKATGNIALTGYIKENSLTASTCLGADSNQHIASSTNCVHSLSVTGPLTNSGTALDPNIACGSCLTTAGGQTITGADTFNGSITDTSGSGFISTIAYGSGNYALVMKSGTSNGNTGIGTGNTWSSQGVACSEFGIINYTVSVDTCMDTNHNWGIGGNVTAANFYNGSKREWKHDIHSIDNWDALDMLPDFYRYKYNKDHGDPNEWKLGYMADGKDGANVWLAGPKHDHFDAGALATLDGVAIKQLNKRVKVLESRSDLNGIVVKGTTHDPRVDALEQQVKLLWAALGLLTLGLLALGVVVVKRA